MSIRAVPIAAFMIVGLAPSASAQVMGPGMYMPGQSPFQQQQQQQQPPCFKDFAPLKAEAERRGLILKRAMETKKASREEACNMIKSYSAAEAKIVKFIAENAQSCGIPQQAATVMKANHDKTLQSQHQICTLSAAGAARPTGPGLSEALGTTRVPGTSLDPLAPRSGTYDTLTGNVLTK
jgi:hypothetical protein